MVLVMAMADHKVISYTFDKNKTATQNVKVDY